MNRHELNPRHRTVGRERNCDLVIEDASVSRVHAKIEVTRQGYIALKDQDSRNGTFVHRKGCWIRVHRVIVGAQDRIRLGDREVPLNRLTELFSAQAGVRLREGYSVRGKPLLFEEVLATLPPSRVVFEQPRRNPATGNIEEGS